MKYIIMPIVRVLYVIFATVMVPFIAFFEGIRCLWNWNLAPLKELYFTYTQRFHSGFDDVRKGDKYYVFRTGWDYIIQRKTWVTKK